jgi:ATP-dependent helicase/nuclease subunit A
LALIAANELNEKDFTQGKRGVFGLYWKLAFFPEELLTDASYPKNYHLEAFENDKWYTEKNKNSIVALKIDSIKGELAQIGREIYDHLNVAPKYIILNEIENSILKIPLLFLVKQEMDLMMKERKEVFLSDFNRWILDIVVKEPVPFIYERIGEKYKNLLIDEFQDTSNSQFFNLLPLIDNSLSNGNFNLIVGDVKQSVYKWRGGNIQLMIDLVNRNSRGLKELNDSSNIQHHQVDTVNRFTDNQTLQVNFRSKREIIEFNNSFFESLVNNQHVEFPYIAKVFSDYKQELPPIPQIGGHAEINFVPYEKDSNLVLKELETLLCKLLNEGSKLSDIAILFRKNKEASEVANFLQLLGYEINSTDSLKLKSNSEVNFLVALLELVNNPTDTFKKFEVLEFFFLINSHISKSEFNMEELVKVEFSDFFSYFLKFDIRVDVDELERFDYFSLMSYFINKFNLKLNSTSLPYLYAFQDLVLNYYYKKSRMLVDFLGYWLSVKETFSIQNKKENALTITTIHKSKGLEYPIVIMPYANWKTEPNPKEELWLDLEEIGYPELMDKNLKLRAAPFKLHKKFANSPLYEKILIQKELHFIENLNMLYVAFTRPIHSLYIFSPFNHQNKVQGVGVFLKTYLESKMLYSENCFKYVLQEGIPFKANIEEKKTKKTFLLKNLGLWSESPSLNIKVDASILNLNGSEKVTMGKLTHAAFELIKNESDVNLTLNKIKNEGWVSKENYENLKEQILKVTQHKDLKFLFHENNIVLNEVEIFSNKIGIQRPDRVVIIDNKVYVIDYKSGEKSSKHKSQLLSYGNLFREMGYQEIHLLLIYLDPLEIIKI